MWETKQPLGARNISGMSLILVHSIVATQILYENKGGFAQDSHKTRTLLPFERGAGCAAQLNTHSSLALKYQVA